jgi:5-methylthioribose kinase
MPKLAASARNSLASISLMLELTEENASEILHAHGHLTDPRTAKVRELSGGVSNAVFLIEDCGERFVVKQARGKLRVQADWQCSVERIWREVEVLATCNELIPKDKEQWFCVPQILWTDQALYAYAMTAAAEEAVTWKEELMSGISYPTDAQAAGKLLRNLHFNSWHVPAISEKFADRTYFVQLRLDPYYRAAAEKHPRLAQHLRDLVDQCWNERHALVHGDFSPKNLLVFHSKVMLIDFEVGHYGDPAFDLGFFLTHLTLKVIHLPHRRKELFQVMNHFWIGYAGYWNSSPELAQVRQRTVRHLAGCLVARVHGKSPVDYLTPPEQLRAVALAEKLFELGPAASWNDAYQLLQRET